ncbi:RING-3 protein [Bimuria novae-zelandiae CBS 107.79]|uniref:RING-3 protein n=1 Tax=Bimuria novae-zelandiae CBS 107.79 TaxID=1447943 RepID=A0A6A5VFN4_9PLEO|nr:RING-3 protein [Bimuria novae-zelandiae CBS 107.79]
MAPRKGTRRACDPCSVRKVRCDGNQPCLRCQTAKWDCTYLKTHGKSGPKGPRRTTEAAIKRFQERSRSDLSQRTASDSDTSFEDGSPTTIDFPLLEPLPPMSEPHYDRLGWPDATSPPFQGYRAPKKISTSTIAPYLEVFQARGYAIWPVVDTEALIARLLTNPDDIEAYGLATAVCAATITQFQIDAEPRSPVEGHFRVSSAMFDSEAKRAREESDHTEHVTLSSLLSAFFLHVYTANIGRMHTSTVLLGEAITKAHMIGLHKPIYYQSMDPEQLQYNVRIYWLLFITERAHSIQNDVPTMLRRCSEIPQLEDLNDGSVTPAFIHLCRLFNILDATLTADPAGARSALALAQHQLSEDEATRGLKNELQRADISMTQQWMRIFLWQHALSVTSLRSSDEEDGFSFVFPANVAQNALGFLCTLSKESLEAHGPGMESKLFDITNSLADVMICVPSLNQETGFGLGPRDLVHSLSSLLGSFRGGNPAVTNILQEKLSTLGLAMSSPRKRLTDLSSSEDEREDWREGSPRSLTWSDGGWTSPVTPLWPAFPPVMSSL